MIPYLKKIKSKMQVQKYQNIYSEGNKNGGQCLLKGRND